MPQKRHSVDQIIAKLRKADVLLGKGTKVPEVLGPVVRRDVRVQQIEDGWGDLVRVAASIEGGWTSAMLALERFGAASSGDPIHRAGTALGKMQRTIFLCDYFSNPLFRRELLRILNHGESVHALQRAIHHGDIGTSRGRRDDELLASKREILELKAKLRRAEEERDILKKAAAYFASHPE